MSSIDVTESATTEKPLEIRSISREDACKISSGQVHHCFEDIQFIFRIYHTLYCY